MKRILVFVFMFSALALGSCKKASGPADKPSVQPDNNRDSLVDITAVINGANWGTKAVYGYNIKSATDSGRISLMITGTQTNNDTVSTLSFTIGNYTGPATYTIDPPANAATYYKGTERHFATSGQVIVLSDSAYAITGTFNFTADTINVTNGVFNIAKP